MKRFSLLELLIVIGLLLLLMSLILPNVGPMMNRADLNRVSTAIGSQLEIAYIKAMDGYKISRVVIENDPKGKSLSMSEISTLSGVSVSNLSDEVNARATFDFDINNDGIPGGLSNKQFFWTKFYLSEYQGAAPVPVFSPPIAADDLKEINAADLAFMKKSIEQDTTKYFFGPFWFKRPICRAKDISGNYMNTKMRIPPVEINGRKLYFRLVTNRYLHLGDAVSKGFEYLQSCNMDGSFILINDKGGEVDYSLKINDMKTMAFPNLSDTFKFSAALYKNINGERFTFSAGSDFNAFYAPKKDGDKAPISTSWFDMFLGDESEPKNADYGANEDEDKATDEGMSVSAELFNETEGYPKDVLPTGLDTYNNYFCKKADLSEKIAREYNIGSNTGKGILLRRIWVNQPGKGDWVLVWRNDKMLDFSTSIGFPNKLGKSTPFYFNIIFDRRNGSGMYVGTSYGSVEISKVIMQVSDDDGKLYNMIEFSDGYKREGTLKELGMPESQAFKDSVNYYQGIGK